MIILPNKGTVDVIKTENDNLYHNTSFVFKISYVRSSPCIIFKDYHYLEVSSLYLNPDVTRLWCLNFPRNPTEISSTNNSQSLYMQQLDQWQSCTNSFHKLPVLHCQLKSTNISILSQNNIKNARNNMANKSNASISFVTAVVAVVSSQFSASTSVSWSYCNLLMDTRRKWSSHTNNVPSTVTAAASLCNTSLPSKSM